MSLEKCSRLAGLRLPHIVTNDYAYISSWSAHGAIGNEIMKNYIDSAT